MTTPHANNISTASGPTYWTDPPLVHAMKHHFLPLFFAQPFTFVALQGPDFPTTVIALPSLLILTAIFTS